MTTTKKPAGNIRIDIANLNADLETIKVAFELMMKSNDNAMKANATSEEHHDMKNLRFNRQIWTIEHINFMIGRLHDLKDSIEGLWN
jgi:hypothetical protein